MDEIDVTLYPLDIDIILESLEHYKSLAIHEHLKYSYDDVQILYDFFKCLL